MKKINFFAAFLLVSGVLFTSCSNDDVVSAETTQQNSIEDNTSTNLTKKAGIETMYFTVSPAYWERIFTNVSVSGNSLIVITLTNTGTTSAYATITTTGYFVSHIVTPTVAPGASIVYNKTISGWSGNPVVDVFKLGSGVAQGTVTIQSF